MFCCKHLTRNLFVDCKTDKKSIGKFQFLTLANEKRYKKLLLLKVILEKKKKRK